MGWSCWWTVLNAFYGKKNQPRLRPQSAPWFGKHPNYSCKFSEMATTKSIQMRTYLASHQQMSFLQAGWEFWWKVDCFGRSIISKRWHFPCLFFNRDEYGLQFIKEQRFLDWYYSLSGPKEPSGHEGWIPLSFGGNPGCPQVSGPARPHGVPRLLSRGEAR